jgi:hypothetical protein
VVEEGSQFHSVSVLHLKPLSVRQAQKLISLGEKRMPSR